MTTPRRTALAVEPLDDRSVPAVFTVTSPGDAVAPGGGLTLREALLAADAAPGPSTVRFDLPGRGPHVIRPGSALPALRGGVTVDGTTQPGFAGTPVVVLDGARAGRADGLTLLGGGNAVRGLVVDHFRANGVVVASDHNVVAGDWVGVDPSGYDAAGNGGAGVLVTGAHNAVGGTRPADRVVVSGNAGAGVAVRGPKAVGNRVAGAVVGSDATGFASVPNGVGVLVEAGATNTTVGGPTRAARNVVSGNAGDQIRVTGAGTAGTVVQGNFVGVDATGQSGALSGGDGVRVDGGAARTLVGGAALGAGNLVGGIGRRATGGRAAGVAVEVAGRGTTGTVIQGNWIGLAAAGTGPLSDLAGGVELTGGAAATVGGAGTAQNVVADQVNAPGLARTNHMLPAAWYTDTIRFIGHPERHGGSFRA